MPRLVDLSGPQLVSNLLDSFNECIVDGSDLNECLGEYFQCLTSDCQAQVRAYLLDLLQYEIEQREWENAGPIGQQLGEDYLRQERLRLAKYETHIKALKVTPNSNSGELFKTLSLPSIGKTPRKTKSKAGGVRTSAGYHWAWVPLIILGTVVVAAAAARAGRSSQVDGTSDDLVRRQTGPLIPGTVLIPPLGQEPQFVATASTATDSLTEQEDSEASAYKTGDKVRQATAAAKPDVNVATAPERDPTPAAPKVGIHEISWQQLQALGHTQAGYKHAKAMAEMLLNTADQYVWNEQLMWSIFRLFSYGINYNTRLFDLFESKAQQKGLTVEAWLKQSSHYYRRGAQFFMAEYYWHKANKTASQPYYVGVYRDAPLAADTPTFVWIAAARSADTSTQAFTIFEQAFATLDDPFGNVQLRIAAAEFYRELGLPELAVHTLDRDSFAEEELSLVEDLAKQLNQTRSISIVEQKAVIASLPIETQIQLFERVALLAINAGSSDRIQAEILFNLFSDDVVAKTLYQDKRALKLYLIVLDLQPKSGELLSDSVRRSGELLADSLTQLSEILLQNPLLHVARMHFEHISFLEYTKKQGLEEQALHLVQSKHIGKTLQTVAFLVDSKPAMTSQVLGEARYLMLKLFPLLEGHEEHKAEHKKLTEWLAGLESSATDYRVNSWSATSWGLKRQLQVMKTATTDVALLTKTTAEMAALLTDASWRGRDVGLRLQEEIRTCTRILIYDVWQQWQIIPFLTRCRLFYISVYGLSKPDDAAKQLFDQLDKEAVNGEQYKRDALAAAASLLSDDFLGHLSNVELVDESSTDRPCRSNPDNGSFSANLKEYLCWRAQYAAEHGATPIEFFTIELPIVSALMAALAGPYYLFKYWRAQATHSADSNNQSEETTTPTRDLVLDQLNQLVSDRIFGLVLWHAETEDSYIFTIGDKEEASYIQEAVADLFQQECFVVKEGNQFVISFSYYAPTEDIYVKYAAESLVSKIKERRDALAEQERQQKQAAEQERARQRAVRAKELAVEREQERAIREKEEKAESIRVSLNELVSGLVVGEWGRVGNAYTLSISSDAERDLVAKAVKQLVGAGCERTDETLLITYDHSLQASAIESARRGLSDKFKTLNDKRAVIRSIADLVSVFASSPVKIAVGEEGVTLTRKQNHDSDLSLDPSKLNVDAELKRYITEQKLAIAVYDGVPLGFTEIPSWSRDVVWTQLCGQLCALFDLDEAAINSTQAQVVIPFADASLAENAEALTAQWHAQLVTSSREAQTFLVEWLPDLEPEAEPELEPEAAVEEDEAARQTREAAEAERVARAAARRAHAAAEEAKLAQEQQAKREAVAVDQARLQERADELKQKISMFAAELRACDEVLVGNTAKLVLPELTASIDLATELRTIRVLRLVELLRQYWRLGLTDNTKYQKCTRHQKDVNSIFSQPIHDMLSEPSKLTVIREVLAKGFAEMQDADILKTALDDLITRLLNLNYQQLRGLILLQNISFVTDVCASVDASPQVDIRHNKRHLANFATLLGHLRGFATRWQPGSEAPAQQALADVLSLYIARCRQEVAQLTDDVVEVKDKALKQWFDELRRSRNKVYHGEKLEPKEIKVFVDRAEEFAETIRELVRGKQAPYTFASSPEFAPVFHGGGSGSGSGSGRGHKSPRGGKAKPQPRPPGPLQRRRHSTQGESADTTSNGRAVATQLKSKGSL